MDPRPHNPHDGSRRDASAERSRPAPRPAEQDQVSGGVEIAPGVLVREDALRFTFARSSGPGGQNVNKRSTKAELRVAIADLPIPRDAASRLVRLAGPAWGRVTDAGELLLVADDERSQRQNREECLDRLRRLVVASMVRPKPRRPTKPTKGSQRRRIEAKKQRGQTKQARRRPADD